MPEDMVQFAQSLDLPQLYFNGFQIGLTNSDISLIMLCNGQPKSIASISFTTAKTLHIGLGEMITALEGATGRTIMTMQDIGEGLEKIGPRDPEASEGQSHE